MSQRIYFGNHYVGAIFDIQKIENCINYNLNIYQKASFEQKSEGLNDVKFDDEIVNWKSESIIFPFLPKKHIKYFKSSTVFMSK